MEKNGVGYQDLVVKTRPEAANMLLGCADAQRAIQMAGLWHALLNIYIDRRK